MTLLKALMGYIPTLHNGLLTPLTGTETPRQNPSEKWKDIRERISNAKEDWKARHNAHVSTMKFEVGEIVMLRQPTISTGKSTKLQRCYRGSGGSSYGTVGQPISRGHFAWVENMYIPDALLVSPLDPCFLLYFKCSNLL